MSTENYNKIYVVIIRFRISSQTLYSLNISFLFFPFFLFAYFFLLNYILHIISIYSTYVILFYKISINNDICFYSRYLCLCDRFRNETNNIRFGFNKTSITSEISWTFASLIALYFYTHDKNNKGCSMVAKKLLRTKLELIKRSQIRF